MSAVLDVSRHVAVGSALSLERQDIMFHCPQPDQLVVSVALTNDSAAPTSPTVARIEAAPLGAFVPWQPLAYAFVPRVEPGHRHVVEFSIQRPPTTALGRGPGDIPPARLLTALAMGEPPRRGQRLLDVSQSDSGTLAFQTGKLPADLFEMLGHANSHWAGNLNVFVGERAVERHLARALRIHPGQVNFASFIVGSGRDAYAFELHGDGADWDAALYHTLARGLSALSQSFDETDVIGEREWVEIEQQVFLILAIRPPSDCGSGNVDVRVTQRSTGRTAVVEFSLDPQAAGPGCFVVE